MIYRVKKGKHHYTPNRLALWRLGRRYNQIELQANVIFSWTTIPPLPSRPDNERLQINKLLGFSWLWRHRNKHSVRVGWRISLDDYNAVEWFLYIRDKGELWWFPVGITEKTVNTELRLVVTRQHTVELYVSQKDLGVEPVGFSTSFRFPQFYGYLAEPYYGGQAPAPASMDLALTQSIFYS